MCDDIIFDKRCPKMKELGKRGSIYTMEENGPCFCNYEEKEVLKFIIDLSPDLDMGEQLIISRTPFGFFVTMDKKEIEKFTVPDTLPITDCGDCRKKAMKFYIDGMRKHSDALTDLQYDMNLIFTREQVGHSIEIRDYVEGEFDKKN